MPYEVNHIVQAIRVETMAPLQADADAFNKAVGKVDFDRIMNMALSGFDFPLEKVRIDTIEVDAGILDITNEPEMEKQLGDSIREALFNKLQNYIQGSTPAYMSGILNKGSSVGGEADDELWDTFIYYLRSGTLPWYAINRFDVRKFIALQLEQRRPEFISRLRISVNNIELLRLWHLLPEGFYNAVSYPEVEEEMFQFFRVVHFPFSKCWKQLSPQLANDFTGGTHFLIFQHIFSARANQPSNVFYSNWLNILFKVIQTESLQHIKTLKNELLLIEQAQSLKANGSMLAITLRMAVANLAKIEASNNIDAGMTPLNGISEKFGLEKINDIQTSPDGNDPLRYESTENVNETEQWYITHSGLVLLNAGMISRSFNDFGWVKEKQIVSEEAASCMRLWLHYLVWGKTPAAEYDLFLGKLLTGCPLSVPVAIVAPLVPYHFQQADALLTDVIEHWKQLKQISIEGLRQGFLQRNGVVKEDAAGFKLYVEKKPHDILLNYLPWPYSIIKFPWMKKPLSTQWSTDI